MKRWLCASLLSVLAASGVFAEEQKSVAVLSIVEHPALDATRDGVLAGLAEEGFVASENLKWQYQSAQGNIGTAGQIAQKFAFGIDTDDFNP